MYSTLQNDLDILSQLLDITKAESLSFLDSISQIPTTTKTTYPSERILDNEGIGTLNALEEFRERFKSIIIASTGPRYWGFVTGGSTPASIAGDWLATVYDQNTQSAQGQGQGDISAAIEFETIRLLLQLFDLPQDYLGGFVTGATMSNFSSLAVARQWIGAQSGKNFAQEGISGTIKVLSATPHSSSLKSLALLGLGSQNISYIKTIEGNREAMDIQDLEDNIISLEGIPFILISSAGTVNTVDFDDFEAIAKLKEKYNFWWHIDAAFGAFAACSPQCRSLLNGWENADSITVDCHKWLNVPYESAFFLVKNKHRSLQVNTFQNSNAPYLGDPLENFNYLNFLPENSRRLKALPVWFSLVAYGKNGYQAIVENSIAMANQLGHFIEGSENFELLAPVRLNTVCFSLKGIENQEKVSHFLYRLNERGQVFMTPTSYNNRKGIRASFVNWRTTEIDIDIAIREINEVFTELNL